MSGHDLLRTILLLTASLAAACGDETTGAPSLSPLEQCLADQADAGGRCCRAADCEPDQVCSFSYICSPTPRGGTQCTDYRGPGSCLLRCDANQPCASGRCEPMTLFTGSDSGNEYLVCVAAERG